jgi:hypothetical protein
VSATWADRRYAWRYLIRYEFKYHHKRSLATRVRSMWLVVVCGHIGETCRDCGRRYLLWMSSDALYKELTGGYGSQFCPACMGRRAEKLGLLIMWVPRFVERDGFTMNDLACEIGAFQKDREGGY